MKAEEKDDIARRVEVSVSKQGDRGTKPNVVRQMELSRRLEARGLIRKEVYNVVRPMSGRLPPRSRIA